MTARELIQKITNEVPDLDAEVYIQIPPTEDTDYQDFHITEITNGGTDDGLFIEIQKI